MAGPLHGVRIVEFAGIGPAPFCASMLADLGAEVVRIDRPGGAGEIGALADASRRGRRCLAIDLKRPEGIAVALALIARADILIEGFRPGVMERLGLGPDECLRRQPRLVYGRITGWGQDGPLARRAGHDINFVALSGALHMIGRRGEPPVVPLNLVGDFGGGGMLLGLGVLAALTEARRSGLGQVVDAAMIDGAAALMDMHYRMHAGGYVADETGASFLAGDAPWYDTYRTRDGRYLAVGALEAPFYALLLDRLGLDRATFGDLGFPRLDEAARARWPALRAAIAARIAERTREEWCAVFDDLDACVSPVLSMAEAARHPHHVARGTFATVDGVTEHAPAPRFSRTPLAPVRAATPAGDETAEVLRDAGVADVAALRAAGVVG